MPRDTCSRIDFARLCSAVLLTLIFSCSVSAADILNFPPSDFDILSADNARLIGLAHYRVDRNSDGLLLRGENRYFDGEYDIEEDHLNQPEAGQTPRLISFRHDFFDAEGSLVMEGRLNTDSKLGTCGRVVGGKMELVDEELNVDRDTYAGASVLLPIQQRLTTQSSRDQVEKFTVFNCAPGPRLIAVDVKLEPRAAAWTEYPGDLERIDIKPNLGFWTVMIQAFIPRFAAWFDPSQDMLLVGAQLQRYYRGPKIILVRRREASISKAPTAPGIPPP